MSATTVQQTRFSGLNSGEVTASGGNNTSSGGQGFIQAQAHGQFLDTTSGAINMNEDTKTATVNAGSSASDTSDTAVVPGIPNLSAIISGDFPAFDAETRIVQPILQADLDDEKFEEGALQMSNFLSYLPQLV
jgi:hypothetical protein